ncbi:MAG TPA: hypothetical protein VGO81_01060 [Solirubrobacteraceae bacterium]|jgi:uncharacterized membrane protein YkoI|nr:hypothetical protein [Solirubrobacteraceae bacterium]
MPAIRNKLTAIAAIGAAGLAGSAIANAASSGTTTSSSSAAQARQAPPQRDPSLGGHQANGKTEKLLTGDTAAKVEAAAKAKVPGGTIERVENDADTGSPYEAHVRKADGSEVIVYVDASFDVTGTGTMGGHP